MRPVMFRWLAATCLAILLCASACISTETPTPTGKALQPIEVDAVWTPLPLSHFEHPSGRFAVSYPTSWTIDTDDESVTFLNQDRTLVICVQAHLLSFSADYPSLTTYLQTSDAFSDAFMEGYIDSSLMHLSLDFPEMPIANLERLGETIQSDGSILARYAFDSEGQRSYGSSFFELREDTIYILTFLAFDAKMWTPMLSTFTQIGNSLETYPTRP